MIGLIIVDSILNSHHERYDNDHHDHHQFTMTMVITVHYHPHVNDDLHRRHHDDDSHHPPPPQQWWSPVSRQQSTGCKAVTAFGRQSIAIQQLNSEQGGIRKLHRHYHHHQTSENQTVNAKNDNNKKRFCSMGVNFTIQILTIFCKNSLQYQYFFLKNIFRDHKYKTMKRISFLGQPAAILCF